jgi:uncharacterized protein (TIGR03118 family)
MKQSLAPVSRTPRRIGIFSSAVFVLFAAIVPLAVNAQGYRQTRLVSDLPNVAAHTDTNLVNAWGLAVADDGTLVVCATESSLAGFYRPDGRRIGNYIEVEEDPTGVEINRWGDVFRLMGDRGPRPSRLLFVTEAGAILGWNPRVDADAAVVAVDNSAADAVYKGVALARARHGAKLYATNFRGGMVEVYDGSWNSLGSFTDTTVDAGFAPFNIANIDGLLYVTFAKQEQPDLEDDEPGPGNGFVDVFDLDGHLLRRFASHGPLNSPWGLALAPRHFGEFSNALLIGNFGDGRINAFHPRTGAFLGPLADAQGNAIVTSGLWALRFGRHHGDDNHESGDHHGEGHGPDLDEAVLYFTAGPGDESHGLVGRIVPERRSH